MKSTLVVSVLLIGLGIFAYVVAGNFPHRGEVGLGPHFYPQLLSVLLVILSLALIVKCFLRPKREAESLSLPDKKTLITALLLLLSLVVYAFMMDVIGYFLATLLFLIALFLLFGERNVVRIGSWTIGITVILWWVFNQFLQVPLPAGVFG